MDGEADARRPWQGQGSAQASGGKAEALVALGSGFFVPARRLIPELALQHRLPSVFHQSQWAESGGLLSYGPSFPAAYRRAAELVAKVLNGAQPGEIPVEQPSAVEMVINLKTAKALGLVIPQSLRLRADQLIA
jgi:putative ABC transport system substrate-binding protein